MEWQGDTLIKKIEAQLGKNVEKAAIHLVNTIKKKLNRSQPYKIYKGKKGRWYRGEDPSKPGESPKKVRGDLQRSITYTMAPDRLSATIGTNLPHAAALEFGTVHMEPRPFLRPALNEEAAKVEEILSRPPK